MKARNVTTHDITDIVSSISREKYNYNVIIESLSNVSSTTVSFKIGTADSKVSGSRRSWTGRHGRWACTHVFEDIMREIISKGGEVLIPKGSKGNNEGRQITLRTEEDLDNWVEAYENTNLGSMVSHAYADEMCVDC